MRFFWRVIIISSWLGGCTYGARVPAPQPLGTASNQVRTLGVNRYLWRATLETLAFLPLQSADPFGGVIITDWYEAQGAPGKRFKVTAYIKDRALRADALTVVVFEQRLQESGWSIPESNAEIARKLENASLSRARDLRLQTLY
jgi:hypothetical protein